MKISEVPKMVEEMASNPMALTKQGIQEICSWKEPGTKEPGTAYISCI